MNGKKYFQSKSWIESMKKKHTRVFEWKELDEIPLAIIINYDSITARPLTVESTRTPEKLFDTVMSRLQSSLEISSDWIPTAWVWNGTPLIYSIFSPKEVPVQYGKFAPTPFLDDINTVRNLEVPKINQGFMPTVIGALNYFKKHLPKGVQLCPPSEAAAIEEAILMRGSDLYLDFYDYPDLVTKLLDIITETIIKCERRIKEVLEEPLDERFTLQGNYFRGIRVPNDQCVNLSLEMLEKFDLPYLKRFCKPFGGRLLLHYCSTKNNPGLHAMPLFERQEEIAAINMQDEHVKYFEEHFDELEKNKCTFLTFINKCKDIDSFKEWTERFLERIPRKAGLFLFMTTSSVQEAQERITVWRELNRKIK